MKIQLCLSAVIILLCGLLAGEVIQKHNVQSELDRTRIALSMTESNLSEFKANATAASAADDQKAGIEAVAGIYGCDALPTHNQVDLRSDGTAVYLSDQGRILGGKLQWVIDGKSITIGSARFTVEGNDLIDYRGNRWLHIR